MKTIALAGLVALSAYSAGFLSGFQRGTAATWGAATALSIDRTNKVNSAPRRVNLNQ
jgi:hypothetical protein